MTTDITELAQLITERKFHDWSQSVMHDCDFCNKWSLTVKHENGERICASCCDDEYTSKLEVANAALVEALEKAQQRNAELEAQNDYFASLCAMARVSADKAIRKFPQPNYVLLKVAEEAGEVVQAGVHYAENRMEWGQVEGEIVQLLAMLIRLVTEGDQVNGITPPASCSAGIKVEVE